MPTEQERLDKQFEILDKLGQAVDRLASKEADPRASAMHTKAPLNYGTFTPLHGAAGVFSGPGLERDVITAHVRPYGIAGTIPILPSVSQDPRYASLTGFSATTGTQPDYVCEDAPVGYMKGCNLTARFGRLRFDTNTIDMDEVMLRVNRGDFTDLVLRGKVLGLTNLEPSGLDQGRILNVVTMSEMVQVGVHTERELNRQFWQGTYGTAHEFAGLDSQIATGIKDADTGVLCPSLDSDVKDFNYNDVASTTPSIVTYLSMLEWYLKHNAMTMGLDPVQWVIAMTPGMWYELSAVWACSYNSDRCTGAVGANTTVFLDGRDNVMERDAMRNGMYIYINGSKYPVIVDTGIYEQDSTNDANLIPGEYAASIYFVPLSITGGFPVLYREFVDYKQAQPDVSLLRGMENFFWTDNGVYSWAYEQVKWCYKFALKTEQRVILRTPQLAGRIDNVKYSPLQHLRDPRPDSPYFKDGGVSLRTGLAAPTAVWAGR